MLHVLFASTSFPLLESSETIEATSRRRCKDLYRVLRSHLEPKVFSYLGQLQKQEQSPSVVFNLLHSVVSTKAYSCRCGHNVMTLQAVKFVFGFYPKDPISLEWDIAITLSLHAVSWVIFFSTCMQVEKKITQLTVNKC